MFCIIGHTEIPTFRELLIKNSMLFNTFCNLPFLRINAYVSGLTESRLTVMFKLGILLKISFF